MRPSTPITTFNDDGSNAELQGHKTLLAYAEKHHFAIAGDYLGEIIADTPAFDFDGRNMLFKQQIPIAVEGVTEGGETAGQRFHTSSQECTA